MMLQYRTFPGKNPRTHQVQQNRTLVIFPNKGSPQRHRILFMVTFPAIAKPGIVPANLSRDIIA